MRSSVRGFTLLELIVVIAIIGVLSVIVIPSFATALARSRDAQRIVDMKNISGALDRYIKSTGKIPAVNDTYVHCGWEIPGGGSFIKNFVSTGELKSGYKDPKQNPDLSNCTIKSNYSYYYYVFSAGSFGCPIERGDFYALGFSMSEVSGRTNMAESPRFSCPGRDYSGEFVWVTGGFSN